MNLFVKFKAALRLREAINRAEQAHLRSGQRYYVLPAGGNDGKLIIMDRDNFRKLRQKKYIAGHPRMFNLMQEAFYFTADRAGRGGLSEPERRARTIAYFNWVESSRKRRKRNGALQRKGQA